ncbi:MAG: hypothetical protein ACTSX7_01610 [Alphaproteobacteria bacterium]
MATLSLFLLLLAFFVLLSTLSRFEATRTKAVLGSLDATFRAPDEVGLARQLDSLVGTVVGAERLEEIVTDILRTAVALEAYKLVRIGSELTATFALSELFEPDSATPRPGSLEFAGALADALEEQPTGLRYEVDVVLHPGDDTKDLAVQRAALLAQVLFDGGVSGEDLAVGLTAGDSRAVRLIFRIVRADNLGLSFGARRSVVAR